MSVGTVVPLEDYLAHTYEPDCEYVDGHIEERNVGEYFHSLMHALLTTYLTNLRRSTACPYRVLTECRVRVRGGDDASRRYRIPDICIVAAGATPASIILTPPLAVIEILSPDDRLPEVIRKCADYEAFGVPTIWIVDPASQQIFRVRGKEAYPEPAQISSFLCGSLEVKVDFHDVFSSPDFA